MNWFWNRSRRKKELHIPKYKTGERVIVHSSRYFVTRSIGVVSEYWDGRYTPHVPYPYWVTITIDDRQHSLLCGENDLSPLRECKITIVKTPR